MNIKTIAFTACAATLLSGCGVAQDALYSARSAVGMGEDAANLTGYGNEEFQQRVNAVKIGMTYKEAAKAMGKAGKKGATQQGSDGTYTYYTWKAPSGKMLDVQFFDNRVVSKTFD